MEISASTSSSFPRSVTPTRSSSDRQSSEESQYAIAESKAQERAQQQRAIQEKLQQNKEETQRRLDGRLISFGQQQDNVSNEQKQTSYNRSRVNEAYSSAREYVPRSEITQSQRSAHREAEPIDIVV